MNHTPTPWKWCGDDIEAGEYGELEVMTPSVNCGMFCYGGMAELGISDADKRHIVRCVNYHDRLVEALRQMHAIAEFREACNPEVISTAELLEQLEQTHD